VLTAALSHFHELGALWTQTRQALESLALSIPPSVAHDSPDDIAKE
jgi:hypothetical protein